MTITNTQWRNAVQRLRRFQPHANNILGDTCHCPKKALMLTYQLDADESTDIRTEPDGTQRESCGYWCSACKFSNAGSRKIEPSEDL